jgi:hypothetical protein
MYKRKGKRKNIQQQQEGKKKKRREKKRICAVSSLTLFIPVHGRILRAPKRPVTAQPVLLPIPEPLPLGRLVVVFVFKKYQLLMRAQTSEALEEPELVSTMIGGFSSSCRFISRSLRTSIIEKIQKGEFVVMVCGQIE